MLGRRAQQCRDLVNASLLMLRCNASAAPPTKRASTPRGQNADGMDGGSPTGLGVAVSGDRAADGGAASWPRCGLCGADRPPRGAGGGGPQNQFGHARVNGLAKYLQISRLTKGIGRS